MGLLNIGRKEGELKLKFQKTKESEKEIQKSMLKYAELFPMHLRLFRRNVGAVKVGGRFVRFSEAGQSDVTGFLSTGKTVEIECKTAKGKMTLEQLCWQETCRRFNCAVYTVRSVEEGRKVIDHLVSQAKINQRKGN